MMSFFNRLVGRVTRCFFNGCLPVKKNGEFAEELLLKVAEGLYLSHAKN
jgi:hypothetical protein